MEKGGEHLLLKVMKFGFLARVGRLYDPLVRRRDPRDLLGRVSNVLKVGAIAINDPADEEVEKRMNALQRLSKRLSR